MIPRGEIIGRLRQELFSFNERGKRTEILRQSGTGIRVAVPIRDLFTPHEATTILRQAGFKPEVIERFLATCLKH